MELFLKTQSPTTKKALNLRCNKCHNRMAYIFEKHRYECALCGNIASDDVSFSIAKENDYTTWDKMLNESSAEMPTVTVLEIKCHQCGVNKWMPDACEHSFCAFCLTPYKQNSNRINRLKQPEAILPFKISDRDSVSFFQKWLKRRWFIPKGLKKTGSKIEFFKGVYIPYWVYDTTTFSEYDGARGEKRQMPATNKKGETVQREVIDWYKSSGYLNLKLTDIMVTASRSLPASYYRKLKNWDLKNAIPFRKELLSGYTTEIYQNNFKETLEEAKLQMNHLIDKAVRNDIGGERQRIHNCKTDFNDLRSQLILLPIWMFAYRYNHRLYQFAINGRTGEVIGEYPLSKNKILKVSLVVLTLVFGALILIL